MEPSDSLDVLRTFRDSLYECFERRADALFELTDAILTAGVLPSPVHLSLETSHRRGWGSLYAALSRGRIEEEDVRKLVVHHPLLQERTTAPVYAVDISVWSRCDAEASPERGYYYHPSRHSAGQPIRRRMGLPVDRSAGLRSRELGRPRGRKTRPSAREPERDRRWAGEEAAWSVA